MIVQNSREKQRKETEAARLSQLDGISNEGKKKKKGANALFLGPLTLPLAIAVGPHELKGFDERTKNVFNAVKCFTLKKLHFFLPFLVDS